MNRFALDSGFLESIAREDNYDLYLNVLVVFAQDNKYKLCLDSSGLAALLYTTICDKCEMLRSWITCLNSRSGNTEIVSLPEDEDYDSEQSLFLSISNALPPLKRLITFNKTSYTEWQDYIIERSIMLIDGDEAKVLMRQPPITAVSYGDNSPIIIGNHNTTNHG